MGRRFHLQSRHYLTSIFKNVGTKKNEIIKFRLFHHVVWVSQPSFWYVKSSIFDNYKYSPSKNIFLKLSFGVKFKLSFFLKIGVQRSRFLHSYRFQHIREPFSDSDFKRTGIFYLHCCEYVVCVKTHVCICFNM